MFSPEPNFWMHAVSYLSSISKLCGFTLQLVLAQCVQLPTVPKSPPKPSSTTSSFKHAKTSSKEKGKAKAVPMPQTPMETFDSIDNTIHDTVLRQLLQRAYESFRVNKEVFILVLANLILIYSGNLLKRYKSLHGS